MGTVEKSLLFLALLLPGLVLAGRPLSTEDASTLDDKACQLEAWVDRTRGDVTDMSVAPACSLFNTEFQLGGARTREAGQTFTSATFFQAKYAFRSVDDADWGIALVAGLARALLHLNIGTTRNRDEDRYLTLWGVAIEKPVTERLALLAEAFGENSRNPFIRAGGRYTLFDKFDVDLTYVTRSGGEKEDRYWSLGFHRETSPLLPRHARLFSGGTARSRSPARSGHGPRGVCWRSNGRFSPGAECAHHENSFAPCHCLRVRAPAGGCASTLRRQAGDALQPSAHRRGPGRQCACLAVVGDG